MSVSGRPNPFKALTTDQTGAAGPGLVSGMQVPGASQRTYPRGISLLMESRLEEMPLRRATLLSVAVHMASPIVLTLVTVLLLLIIGWLLNINIWDWFKPQEKPADLVFTIVDDRNDARPETAKFRSLYNQQAGGVADKKRPLTPAEEQVAPQPKPEPVNKPDIQPTPATVKNQSTPPTPPKAPQAKPDLQPRAATRPSTVTAVRRPEPSPQLPTNPLTAATETGANPVASAGATASPPVNPESGKGKRPGVNVQQDVDMGPYMADMKKRIDRNWKAQGIRTSRDHEVKLLFYITRDGSLDTYRAPDIRAGEPKIEVKRSSGDTQVDQWAINAVMASAPFKPLPPQLQYDVVPVEFKFDYNVIDP